MFRNGRNKNGFVNGNEGAGGGEAIVDPDEEWNDVDRGDLGELTDDSGESQTLMIGEDVSLRSGSSIFILGTRLFWVFDSNMAYCLQNIDVTLGLMPSNVFCVCHYKFDVFNTRVLIRLEDVTNSQTQPSQSKLRQTLASDWTTGPTNERRACVIDVSVGS